MSNASYTLSFAVGRRADFALPSSYSVELLAGGSVLATWSSADNTPPSAGSFVPETLTFSSATVNAAHAGQSLGILMLTSGSTSQQANFDNFSLNVVTGVSAIPEPTAGGLLLIALIGIAAVRREWT
ncbi:MAG: PEP-CTERM sorting domain-containing protein [Proteobacteria bacterium]|nr:PEP-CTERM sorting domain-containing protein [Pseudomonadota bacterium]